MTKQYKARKFTNIFGETRYAVFHTNKNGVFVRTNNRDYTTIQTAKRWANSFTDWHTEVTNAFGKEL